MENLNLELLQNVEDQKKEASVVDYKMVTFSLAGKDYAIDIMKVKEIAQSGRYTYVPNTQKFVLGVFNLRGEIIPIIDLRLFFNIETEEKDDRYVENMLIVTVGDQNFGVVVDAVDKVVGIQKSSIQPPHPLFGDISIKYIQGVVEANKRLYILLDINRIFGLEEEVVEEEPEQQETVEQAPVEQPSPAPKPVSKPQVQSPSPKTVAKTVEQPVKAPSPKPEAEPVYEQKQQIISEPVQKPVQESIAAVEPEVKIEVAAPKGPSEVDWNFLKTSLAQMKNFNVSEINENWVKNRFEQWTKEKGEGNSVVDTVEDSEKFLATFYSSFNGELWTSEFCDKVIAMLPDNQAKTVTVWNPGCGKGFETYSLACALKKRYPDSRIRIFAHDVDLLAVSNAPLFTLPDRYAESYLKPYLSTTAGGQLTFSKEIKDMIMFEYHDCVNTNALPPLDIVFARDVISFLTPEQQKGLLEDFDEKLKGNGLLILGDNEKAVGGTWKKLNSVSVNSYIK